MFIMVITAFWLAAGSLGQVVITDIPSMEECEAAIPRYQASIEEEARAAGHEIDVDVTFTFECMRG